MASDVDCEGNIQVGSTRNFLNTFPSIGMNLSGKTDFLVHSFLHSILPNPKFTLERREPLSIAVNSPEILRHMLNKCVDRDDVSLTHTSSSRPFVVEILILPH